MRVELNDHLLFARRPAAMCSLSIYEQTGVTHMNTVAKVSFYDSLVMLDGFYDMIQHFHFLTRGTPLQSQNVVDQFRLTYCALQLL